MQTEESIIASNLEQYVKDERMLLLPIPVLYRILQIYINKSDKKAIKDKEIIQFLFKCLDKYGEDASILYNGIDFEEASIEITSSLIKHYSNKFNFNMIGSTLLRTTIDLLNDKEKSCILINEMQIKLEDKEKEFEQLKSQYKNDIDRLKKEEEKRNDEYSSEINKLNEEINQKNQILNFIKKGNSLTVLKFIPQMKYYLKSDTGKIVNISSTYPNPLTSNSNASNDPYTSIFFIRNSDYTISIKSAINDKYVTVDVNKEGQLFAKSNSIGLNEKFIMVDMPNGGFAFQSLANNKYVCNLRVGYIGLTEDSLSAYVNHKDTWETFLIYSIDGKQII